MDNNQNKKNQNQNNQNNNQNKNNQNNNKNNQNNNQNKNNNNNNNNFWLQPKNRPDFSERFYFCLGLKADSIYLLFLCLFR